MADDSYTDPVTGAVLNNLGLSTAGELAAAEREITHAALILSASRPFVPATTCRTCERSHPAGSCADIPRHTRPDRPIVTSRPGRSPDSRGNKLPGGNKPSAGDRFISAGRQSSAATAPGTTGISQHTRTYRTPGRRFRAASPPQRSASLRKAVPLPHPSGTSSQPLPCWPGCTVPGLICGCQRRSDPREGPQIRRTRQSARPCVRNHGPSWKT